MREQQEGFPNMGIPLFIYFYDNFKSNNKNDRKNDRKKF